MSYNDMEVFYKIGLELEESELDTLIAAGMECTEKRGTRSIQTTIRPSTAYGKSQNISPNRAH